MTKLIGLSMPCNWLMGLAAFLALSLELSSSAIADSSEIKAQIINEIAGKRWEQLRRPSPGYRVGRFTFTGSSAFPAGYRGAGLPILQQIADGKFEVVQPTQSGAALQDMSAYLSDKPACSSAPIRYWNGISEMPAAQYEHLKSKKSSDITPYLPGTARPIDYETQLGPDLEVVATAVSGFEFYDLAAPGHERHLRVFRAEDYVPSSSPSDILLEGSFAAYEIPGCRFMGTLDYFTRCIDVRSSPIRQRDALAQARVIKMDGRLFVITLIHPNCDAQTPKSNRILYLWDLTASEAVPAIFGFTELEAD